MVTVLCPVFNNFGYIRQCLESLVMQETDFVYEVIVRDDASTDGTDRIIREFAEKYPSVVRAVIERENMNGHFGERVVSMIRGEYVAFCEGDDFWTDSRKLQKQYDYMVANPDCALCVHNVTEMRADRPAGLFFNLSEGDYSGEDACRTWMFHTSSFFARTSCYLSCLETRRQSKVHLTFGDTLMVLACANSGRIHALPDVMSVYRRHNAGWTARKSARKYYETARSWEEVPAMFGERYKVPSRFNLVYNYLMGMVYALKEGRVRLFFLCVAKGIMRYPAMTWEIMMKVLKTKASRHDA